MLTYIVPVLERQGVSVRAFHEAHMISAFDSHLLQPLSDTFSGLDHQFENRHAAC